MFDFIGKIQLFLQGKKTYLVMIASVIALVVAFGDGSIDFFTFIKSLAEAIGLMTLRAGVTNATKPTTPNA